MRKWLTFGGVWILGVGMGLLGADALFHWSAAQAAPVAARAGTSPTLTPPVQFSLPDATPAPGGYTFPAASLAVGWPEVAKSNPNGVIARYRAALIATASSQDGPPFAADKLLDGLPATSWFGTRGDTATQGRQAWVNVLFPEGVAVRHVTILGNRDPAWGGSYRILTGRLEFFDAEGKVIYQAQGTALGAEGDFDFALPTPAATVRMVRFTALTDEGDKNAYQEVALGEILID